VAAPDPAVLTEADCGLCGSARKSVRFEAAPYRVVECQDCGLVYVTPRRDEAKLRAMYSDDYWRSPAAKDFGYTDYVKDEALYLKTYRKRFAVLEAAGVKGGRILDVGCAAGYFLAVAKERGFTCTGVEVSAPMAEFARSRYGLDVKLGTLLEQGFAPASFDAVTFWDVVEHLPDPAAVLREARRVLTPGGLLLVETQNVGSSFARKMGPKWHHYKHAEHLYHFDPATLGKLLVKSGFEMTRWQSKLGGKYVSLDFIAERAGRVHPVLSTLLAPLRLLGGASLYINLNDEMIALARPARK
jgi:2-polyprenyl-3-methyl-5-hydroxy-6-metoxy-1,4-benzoquinol methylase